MLTPKQFGTHSAKARYDIVISVGTYLKTMLAEKTAVNFYFLYTFIVEVWKNTADGTLIKVEASPPALYKKIYKEYSICLN
jgi:hypothetical protein